MRLRTIRKIAERMILTLFLFTLPLPVWGEEKSVNVGEVDEPFKSMEPINRLQIAQEHHILMQHIIESLSEAIGLLQRVAKGNNNQQELEDVQAKADNLGKRVEVLSEKHHYLMSAIEVFKEASHNKKIEEDEEKRDKDTKPTEEP